MDPRRDVVWEVLVPVLEWGAAVLVCVVLGVWLSGVIRRFAEEAEPGRRACPRCGYDVRATPERCPECGELLPPQEDSADQPAIEAEPLEASRIEGGDMPIYSIPPQAGPFVVVEAPDKSLAVADERAVADPATAAKLGFVFIPCRDRAQAEALADRLNRGEHGGSVQVDLLESPVSAPAPERAPDPQGQREGR